MGVLASCHEASGACTPPALGFPTDGLDALGLLFESEWPMAPDLRGRAVGPGACDQNASGLAGASLGNRSLSAVLAGGICGGDQAQNRHSARRP